MNEISLLVYLLSRAQESKKRGATEEEIQKALHLPDKTARGRIFDLLRDLNDQIRLLGLEARYNPLDRTWFICHQEEIVELTGTDPFGGKKRLGATLLAILIYVCTYGNTCTMAKLRKVRKKQDLSQDLQELANFGFIELDEEEIRLTPLIGYHCDIEKLFREIERDILQSPGNPTESCED